jgi:hypothetical protein
MFSLKCIVKWLGLPLSLTIRFFGLVVCLYINFMIIEGLKFEFGLFGSLFGDSLLSQFGYYVLESDLSFKLSFS